MSAPDPAADAASSAEREPRSPAPPPARRRRPRWLRAVLVGFAAVVAVLCAAAAWLVLDPGLIRPLAEHLATAAAGRPVVIRGLEFRVLEGRVVVDATGVRVGRTTTERVSLSLAGMYSQVHGEGVRFPNGSSVEQFRASLELSLAGIPRIATVDATGVALIATRRAPGESSATPPLARLLVVPRILLGLGLERLVLHSGRIEYRGRSSVHTAGMTAVIAAGDGGVSLRGNLQLAPELPDIAFDGTVRDPMGEGWTIDLRLTGDAMPMEGVRLLAGVLEPRPSVRATLDRSANESHFEIAIRLARARIDTVTLDLAFDAPRPSSAATLDLEGVRFVARAVPDPGGWTVTGEADWARVPGGASAAGTPFTLRWSTGVPGSLRWSARRVSIPLLVRLANRNLDSDHPVRAALERLRPTGTLDEVAAFGDPAARSDPASFWLSAALSGFGAAGREWRIVNANVRLDFAGGEWRVRFANDSVRAEIPAFHRAPYELTLHGELRIARADAGWAVRTASLEVGVAGIAARLRGSLAIDGLEGAAEPRLDAEIRFNDVPLAAIADVLPDRRGAKFTSWYRRAVRSGRLAEGTVRIRGDPRSLHFMKGGGTFEAHGTVRDVELAYARRWPAIRVEEARFRADGAVLEFSDVRGSIFDTAITHGTARLEDVTDLAGRVRVEASGSGPARDLLEFVRASPLGPASEGAAPEVLADGPAVTAIELDVPYGRDAASRRLGVTGTIELDGVAFRLAGRRAVLESVRGALAFDAETLSGGPMPGRLRGETIESHVAFDRREGLRLRFSGEGDGAWFKLALRDLADIDEAQSGPWLDHLLGRTAWNAEYRARGGIVVRSDLRTASVDFPPPFRKPAGEARQLDVRLTPGATGWRIEADYGPHARGVFEAAETDGAWSLARGAVVLGGARPAALPDTRHVEVSGRLTELDIDPWLALGAPGPSPEEGWLSRIGRLDVETRGARAFGRPVALDRIELTPTGDGAGYRFRLFGEGVAGEVLLPADPDVGRASVLLDRLHFDPAPDAEPSGDEESTEESREPATTRWPAFDARIDSLRFGGLDFGSAWASGDRSGNGLEFEELRSDGPGLRMRGRGSWRVDENGVPASRLDLRVNTDDLARVLSTTGVENDAAAAGVVDLHLDLAWPGPPLEPSFARIEGEIGLSARDGHLPRVRVGPFARLLALLSFDALPRVLALDLSHVVGRGLAYDRIEARTQVADGVARIRELTISGPSAQIEIKGNVDLAARRYDQEITVIPRVTRSGALLPVWATVWPVLVGNFVLEKVSGKEVLLDRLFRLKYRVRGPWDEPQIERLPLVRSSGETR